MKKLNYLTLLCLSSILLLTSCHFSVGGRNSSYHAVKGSGVIVKKSIPVSRFNAIRVSNAIHVILTDEVEGTVMSEVDRAYEDYLDIHVSGETLNIAMKNMTNGSNASTIKVYVSGRGVSNYELSSASLITAETKLVTHALTLDMSSASRFTAEVACNKVIARLSSAARLDLSGAADSFDLGISSAAMVSADSLIVKKVVCNASSGSSARVYASEELHVDASSAARIKYGGEAKIIRIETSSAASVSK